MRNWKKGFALIMAFVMVFAVAACSNGNGGNNNEGAASPSPSASSEPSASAPAEKEDVTLRLMWWGSQTRHDMTAKLIEMYEAENPHVTIEGEFTSFNGYWEKLAAMAAGGNMPDVLQMNFGEYLNQYAEKDVLLDLTELTTNGTIDVSKASEGIMASGVKSGKLLGIPTGQNALGAIYDPALLEKAGVSKMPGLDWTWDDWKSISEAVKGVTGEYGSQGPEAGNIFEYYSRSVGEQMWNAEGLAFSEQSLIDYFTMNLDLQEAGLIPTLDVALQHEAIEDQLIVHGKAAFDFRWSNQVVALVNAAQRPLAIAPLPGPGIDSGMWLKPAMFWSISKDSKNQEEAAKFIDWMTNNLEAQKVMNGDRGVPISSDIREQMAGGLDETNKMIFDYISLLADHSSAINGELPPNATEVLDTLKEIHEQVMYKQMSPEEGAKAFIKQANDIISRG